MPDTFNFKYHRDVKYECNYNPSAYCISEDWNDDSILDLPEKMDQYIFEAQVITTSHLTKHVTGNN